MVLISFIYLIYYCVRCGVHVDRARFLGELGAIIGGVLFLTGMVIYYIERKKRIAFSKRIYID